MYVHLDSLGIVWARLEALSQTTCTNQTISEFIKSFSKHKKTVRVLGMAANAPLICALNDKGFSVEVGSPSICQTLQEAHRPDLALQRAMYLEEPVAFGGWHLVRDADMATYRMITSVQSLRQRGKSVATRELLRLLRQHPAYPALSFPGTCDLWQCACLVELVVDPRWYVSKNQPDSCSRLIRYLGLSMRNARYVRGEGPVQPYPPGGKFPRTKLVIDTWMTQQHPPTDTDSDPRHFLWRKVKRTSEGLTAGILAASKLFVMFVRGVWLDRLAGVGDGLFDPATFFADARVAEAFRKHCLTCR